MNHDSTIKEKPLSAHAPEGTNRVLLRLSYDGRAYEGWQKQKRGQPTIQATLEKALSRISGETISVVGASRTDSGVHAVGQMAHFDIKKDPGSYRDFAYTLQSVLPDDIVVKSAWSVPREFDCCWDAESKIYKYLVFNSKRPSALQRDSTYWIRRPLDLDWLNEASQIIVGRHDFASFRNVGGTARTTTRTILSAAWKKGPGALVTFEIHGEGFLKQMVRNLAGTLLYLPPSRDNLLKFKSIIDARDRKMALITAPAHALYLVRIFYPDHLDNRWRKL